MEDAINMPERGEEEGGERERECVCVRERMWV